MFCGSALGEEVVSRSRYSPAETIKQNERAQIRMVPYVRTEFVDEYLQEIGKTDLALLTQEEWLTFLQCVGGEVTRMFPFNDEMPF